MALFGDERRSWKLYLKAIETFVGGDTPPAGEVMQPLAVVRFVDWDNADAPDYDRYRQWMFSNDILRWGGLGTRTGTSFVKVYGDFLTYLLKWAADNGKQSSQLSDEERNQISRYSTLQQDAEKDKNYYYSKAEQSWEYYRKAHENDPLSETQDEFYQSDSNYQIGLGYERLSDSYAYNILKIMSSRIDPDFDIINTATLDYKSPDYMEPLPQNISEEGKPNKYVKFRRQSVGVDIFKFKRGTNNANYTINERSEESTSVETKWGGSLGVSVGIFSFGGGASGSHLEQEATQKATSVTITFDNFGEFPIERGNWFGQNVIDRFGKNLPEFWGPQGYMSVYPTSIILAKGISVNIVTDDTHTTRSEDHFKENGSIGFGPFSFGQDYSKDYIHATFENRGTNFTLKSIGDDVYVIGYRCTTPNVPSLDYHLQLMKKQQKWNKSKTSKRKKNETVA